MKNSKDGNDIAAAFISDINWDTLDKEVQQRAKWCLLDDLGATISGTQAIISQISTDYVADQTRSDEATILLRGKRSTAAGAAFANANTANALDIDDCSKYTRGHPGALLFPAALAVAEKYNATGKEFLEALVVGYEIALYTGRCWHDDHEVYQACGSWGSVGCAAIAARLMKLNHEQIKNALGIADYHAPNLPMMRDIDNPTMVKHGIGWGAMTGIMAAELAERGYTGIGSILGFEKYHHWVKNLGSEYLFIGGGIEWKRWCSCAWTHAALAAVEKLVEQNNIQVEDIARISVHTFRSACRLSKLLPESTEMAQFNLKWPMATMLADGGSVVGPDQILERRFNDPKAKALFDKIEVIEDEQAVRWEEIQIKDPDASEGKLCARVEVDLADGQSFDSGYVKLTSITWDEKSLEDKFRWLAGFVLQQETINELVRMVWDMENVPTVKKLVEHLQ